MSWIWSTVYLPPNVVDVQVVDIDKDGIQEIVVAAKASLETVPAPITLFVYEKKSEGWAKRHMMFEPHQYFGVVTMVYGDLKNGV